jgi:hypothetical protein
MPPFSLREPFYRLLRSVSYLRVGASSTIQRVVTVHTVLGVDGIGTVLTIEEVGPATAYHLVVAQATALGVVAAPP